MADPRLKILKIKTGVLKRLAKEKTVYEKEVDQQKAKIEKLKNDEKDEYEIKKQEEVLQECLMMIPDCNRRLNIAFEDLKNLLSNEVELKELEEYTTAANILKDVNNTLPNPFELKFL